MVLCAVEAEAVDVLGVVAKVVGEGMLLRSQWRNLTKNWIPIMLRPCTFHERLGSYNISRVWNWLLYKSGFPGLESFTALCFECAFYFVPSKSLLRG